eukprot:CAMPEP_0201564260 /NCGR_PEP_ID=MMETSP0190_2-20130828/2377_1 /ASSEMBLY_ACC=CAM_ASM_000263 /TAXON_ID=37353 /ORGANISM="Rosalina sp." /LENGTH=339 /DNA_ID=CAMNT_0047980187 /DNA_START=19 /DNA_END=1038 /DNA_ORIENTATION=+
MAMLKWIMFEMETLQNQAGYDQELSDVPHSPLIEIHDVQRGFKSKEQAHTLAENFYAAICASLSSDRETTANDPVCKFLNTDNDNFTFILGGTTSSGLEQWLPFHNKYGKMIKKATSLNVKIKSWMSNSCVVTYQHHFTFINDQQYTVHGNAVFVIKNDKKIKYVIETPRNDDLMAMNPIIASIMNIPKEKMVSGLGLKSKEEAQELASNFNVTKLASIITAEDDDAVMKLIDTNDFTMISAGSIMTGTKDWIPFHNGFIQMINTANSWVKVEEWMSNSITMSYQFDLTFIDDQECTIRGYSTIVVSNDKKIKYVVESPQYDDHRKMNMIIESIMEDDY